MAGTGRPNPADYIVRDAQAFGGDVSLPQQRPEQRSTVQTPGLTTQPPIGGSPLRSLQSNLSSAGKFDAERTIEDDTSNSPLRNENTRTSTGESDSQQFDSNHRSIQRQPPGWRLRRADEHLETPQVQDENNESHVDHTGLQSHAVDSNHRNIQRQPPGWRPRRSDHHVDTPVLVLAAAEDLHKILSILGNDRAKN